MTAPATMKELEAKMITPWVFMEEFKTYPEDAKKQVNNWMRQWVNAGTAQRFNQQWPTGEKKANGALVLMKEAEGKTLILTSSLAEAHHTKTPLRFGALDYTIAYIKGEKYGTVYAVHKGAAAGYTEAERKTIFQAIHRRAILAEYTQHIGQQTFEYNEPAQQYLIATPLSAKATKVFDDALKALQIAPEPEASMSALDQGDAMHQAHAGLVEGTVYETSTTPLPINDPVAQQNINCASCDAPITIATAQVRALSPTESEFICTACAEG